MRKFYDIKTIVIFNYHCGPHPRNGTKATVISCKDTSPYNYCIEFSDGNKKFVFSSELTLYQESKKTIFCELLVSKLDLLWNAHERGASMWIRIRERNGSEKELELK